MDREIAAALAALQAGNAPEAARLLEAIHARAPDHHGVIRSLAAICEHQRRYDRLLEIAEKGLALAPDDTVLRDKRLAALARGGKPAEALPEAAATVVQRPNDPDAVFRLADTLLLLHRPREALPHFTTAIKLAPAFLPALLGGAEAAFQVGEIATTRQWLDDASRVAPKDRAVRMTRATILLSLGDWGAGLDDYEARLWPSPELILERRLPQKLPRWQGEALGRNPLLVCAEQGIGDQIRLARQLPLLQQQCEPLIVECARRLVPLLMRALPSAVIRPAVEQRDGIRHVFHYDWLAGLPRPAAYIEIGSVMLRLYQQGIAPDQPRY